jgi:hypothetical protein
MLSFDSQQWTEFVNNSATQAPAFGALRVTGVSVVAPGRVLLTVDQPNAYGCQGNCFLIGPVPVAAGKRGYCTRSGPLAALYDSADGTPAFGDAWGPRNGTWKLKKNTGGFFCLGGPTNAGQALALFVPVPMREFICQNLTGSDISQGSSGTVTILAGAAGSETSTGLTVTALARWGKFKASAKGRCQWDGCVSGSSPSWTIENTDTC